MESSIRLFCFVVLFEPTARANSLSLNYRELVRVFTRQSLWQKLLITPRRKAIDGIHRQ